MFEHPARQQRRVGGVIQLTDAMFEAIGNRPLHALRYRGARYDCGSELGYLQATVVLGQRHPEVGAEFALWLSDNRSRPGLFCLRAHQNRAP